MASAIVKTHRSGQLFESACLLPYTEWLNTTPSVLALKNPRIFDLAPLPLVSAGPSESARKRLPNALDVV